MKTKDIIDMTAEFLYNNSQYVSNKERGMIHQESERELEEPEFLKQKVVLPNGTFCL